MRRFNNLIEEAIEIGFDHDHSEPLELDDFGQGNTGFRGYRDESEGIIEKAKSVKFRVRARQPKFKRYKKFKARAKERLGARADTDRYIATHKFDLKTKRYIKRKKPMTLGALRKKRKIFKKTMKRRNPNMR